MRSAQSDCNIYPFVQRSPGNTKRDSPPIVEPLRRIELHQVERDEIGSLRQRLLELIIDAEQKRKMARFRLVN